MPADFNWQIAKKTKLNHPTNLVRLDFKPRIRKPAMPDIPPGWIEWHYENETHDDLVSKAEAEVDMDKGELKSLYFDNQAFWNHPPPIDVPISLPVPPQTNTPSTRFPSDSVSTQPPPRLLKPFKLPP